MMDLALLAVCILLVACLAYFSTLKMDAVYSSEMSVNFYQTTWHHIPEDSTLLKYAVTLEIFTKRNI
jgi:hypothetical protein